MTQPSDGKKPLDKPKNIPAPAPRAAESLKASDPTDGLEAPSHNNIEKIRTILFGNQIRDFEARFARLEEQLTKEVSELRADFRRRGEALESYVRQEIDSVNERLSGEYEGRSSALSELQSSLEALGQELAKKTHQIDDTMNKTHRELRQQVLGQSKQLRDEMQSSLNELSALIERELKQVRTDKTDRSALASMLTDLAARLTADN